MNFVVYVHKPKARAIATSLAIGAAQRGYRLRISEVGGVPRPDEIAIFYGVVPDTWKAFALARAEGRAVYLDNGFLNSDNCRTLRFAWNGVQAAPEALRAAPERALYLGAYAPVPDRKMPPEARGTALLCLQSPQYFDNVRAPHTWAGFARSAEHMLMALGYRVVIRPKPRKNEKVLPLYRWFNMAGIVVSANSSASVRAVSVGVPGFCLLPSTMSPLCPQTVPEVGTAHVPAREDVQAFIDRLASQEVTYPELETGAALDLIMGVADDNRKGISYDDGQ